MVAALRLQAVVLLLNGLRVRLLTKQDSLRIVRLQQNSRYLRLKYIVVYWPKMLSKPQ